MKVCPYCNSTAFDDMAVCYGCLRPFDEATHAPEFLRHVFADEDEELQIEEPSETAVHRTEAFSQIRLHVAISDLFGYDIYLNREEGAQLTIGCARDNNIVLPHTESKRHLLKLHYAQGQVWAQDMGSTQKALIDQVLLTGTRCLQQGALLEIGEARIELIEC
ncbi:MAG: FHA domain-containing protein [Coriobacteriales bacterium]|jgi:hypothetical protein|nr:FHA domain-containing protein [Coriobacteriales bacterium]